MSLLLDQNLSRRLVVELEPDFPGVTHVALLNMDTEEDEAIWNFAAENHLAIVTKDKDFYQRSLVRGHPPKIIHLKLGNCTTQQVLTILSNQAGHIRQFLNHPDKAYLLLA